MENILEIRRKRIILKRKIKNSEKAGSILAFLIFVGILALAVACA